MTFFERLYDSRSCFDGSMSIHTLSLSGMVVVPVDSFGWGFAFAFDLACNHSWACWYIFLFLWICKILRVVFDVIVHIPNCSVGNSDPRMRIVFVHGLNSNFDSEVEVRETCRDFQYGSNSRVSSDPPFWLRSLVVSRKGVFATSHSMKLCEICIVFRHEILSVLRSQIGLGLDWVGLEDSAQGASPSDCWTNFPIGRCSTVEPDWSFPSVHLWSCFNETFGGGRGDKYRVSCNISPLFNLSTFEIQWTGSVPWRTMAFDRIWSNVGPSLIARSISTQHTESWCLFHALCKYRAWRGTLKSIFSQSLWLLSPRSKNRKNNVCLLLEFSRINPLLKIEWRLKAHPIW